MTTAALPTVTRDEAHRYWYGGQELFGVTRVLELTGLSDFSAPHFTDAVRDRGQYVAMAVELLNEGTLDLDTLDPQLVPYVDAYAAFVRESGVTVEHCERIVYDVDHGYAGTLDLIVTQERRGRLVRMLIDLKLGLYDSVRIQTAAYARAARSLYPTPVVMERRALILRGDGSYTLTEPFTNHLDEVTFLAALRVVQWRKSNSGAPV